MRQRFGIPPWWLWFICFVYVGIGPKVAEFMLGPVGYWVGLVMGVGLFAVCALVWAHTREDD